MSEVRSGVRHLLANPEIYNLFQRFVGAVNWRKKALRQFVIPLITSSQNTVKVLDIGCGTGEILSWLPSNVEYVGFDRNQKYIEFASRRYSNRHARFICDELTPDYDEKESGFQIVLAFGLLHHLDDQTGYSLFNTALRRLQPGGFLLTLDPLYTQEQSWLAKFIVSKDRGKNVRTEVEYQNLAHQVFADVDCYVDMNPIHIPYTGLVMKCTNRGPSGGGDFREASSAHGALSL